MNMQQDDEGAIARDGNQGGAMYDDLGSGSTAGYGATDADAVGRGDAMDDDELLDEDDDDNTDPMGDELEEDMDNNTTSAGRSDY